MIASPALRPHPCCLRSPMLRWPRACQGMPARALALNLPSYKSVAGLSQKCCGSISAAAPNLMRRLDDFTHVDSPSSRALRPASDKSWLYAAPNRVSMCWSRPIGLPSTTRCRTSARSAPRSRPSRPTSPRTRLLRPGGERLAAPATSLCSAGCKMPGASPRPGNPLPGWPSDRVAVSRCNLIHHGPADRHTRSAPLHLCQHRRR
jgi:hypothetical protein